MAIRNVAEELVAALKRGQAPTLEEIQWIVHADPSVASRFLFPTSRTTPLHQACGNKHVGVEVIEFFINQWPESVFMPCDHGTLPIHYACESKLDLEIVKVLLQRFPDSVKGTCALSGNTALHYASTCLPACHVPRLDVVKFLYEKFPDAIEMEGDENCLPIHLALQDEPISSNDAIERDKVVRFLAETCPTSLLIADCRGFVPLHYACERRDSLALVQFLVDLSPLSVRCYDGDTYFPLGRALLFYEDDDVPINRIEYLLEKFVPPCILHQCYDGYLTACPLVLRHLVDKFPESVKERKMQKGESLSTRQVG